ncbi:MAG TPA: transglycosylase domain-containing protein [Acidimicrobiales bacterium]|jgi:penicillin-binding protein 1A|nr:transglycosylase domain-containing protein [Acidimicrobiales bacterium]
MALDNEGRNWFWRHRKALWLGATLTCAAVAIGLYRMAQVPLPEPGALAETTVLTDVNGARLASIDSGEDRTPVPLETVPPIVVQAVLASEDRNFYDHGGIDPVGVVRAAMADVRGRPLQGGSTITQQYVKQVYLSSERTLTRKVREAALALKVERRWQKDEILERYLNTVYFGRGAYGVQAASRAYFAKDVGDLTLSQAAYLAGLIRSPNSASPDDPKTRPVGQRRRDRALSAMREEGWITAAQERAAAAEALDTEVLAREQREPEIVGTDKGTSYFVEYVRAELVRRYGEDTTYQGGLRVKTSLDLNLQAQAYDAVYGFLDRPDSDPAGALVSIDDQGRVLAMVGGRNFTESKVNYAVGREGGGSGRQGGSTFKPFLLAALVKDGYSVQSSFPAPDRVVLPKANEGKDYEVENYEEADYGDSMNLIDATASSVNTVYIQAQESLGRQRVADMAKELGVRKSPVPAVASTVLGTAEVSVLEMASAYSTFAARGVHVEPRVILEVRRADGTVIEPESPPQTQRVLSTDEADVVNHCLRQVVLRGSGVGAKLSSVQVAGKTGTAQNYGDAWFVGYTPKLTTAVWMGFPEGNKRPMLNVRDKKVSGGSFPATIFRRFMEGATKDPKFQAQFPKVSRFKGKALAQPAKVVLPTTTTTSTTTTTAPDAGTDDDSKDKDKSTTTTAPTGATTTRPSPTTTAAPASTTAPPPPPTTAAPPG